MKQAPRDPGPGKQWLTFLRNHKCFWVGKDRSNRESVQNPKPRHFKLFEFFDHTGGARGTGSGADAGVQWRFSRKLEIAESIAATRLLN
jgi:hypothetical protein